MCCITEGRIVTEMTSIQLKDSSACYALSVDTQLMGNRQKCVSIHARERIECTKRYFSVTEYTTIYGPYISEFTLAYARPRVISCKRTFTGNSISPINWLSESKISQLANFEFILLGYSLIQTCPLSSTTSASYAGFVSDNSSDLRIVL